ncbi:MAG: tRNA lysidine(34) synthetase TilS [Betaproteobacteria bacterium]|nr:tRNA lysidine(34) synthetase TilS [Betaproteobacteria bacterium]
MVSSRKAPSAESSGRLEAHVAAEMTAQVAAAMTAQVAPGAATVTVGLSGGVDSVVLLALLRRIAPGLGFELRALHVNHGLSPHAADWERFCQTHCARRRVPFQAVRVRVPGEGSNIEAQARAARYRAFSECGSELIALAHHRDDQAETLLLNLVRGSGVHGLAGMPAVRSLDGAQDAAHASRVRLIRPLLRIARSDLLRYARSQRLRWIEDESNRDARFTRNFLRLQVLPLLERRFPGTHETLARSAAHLRDAAALLDELAAADCAASGDGHRLDLQRLCALGAARGANALRHLLACHGEAPPSLARTREMLRQLTSARTDAQPAIDLERISVRRFRGWIELVALGPLEREREPLPWNGERSLRLADGAELIARPSRGNGISAARLHTAAVTIRRRRGGERVRIAHTGAMRTLKNLLQEAGVAPWVRARMPLVYCGERFAWAPFVGVAADFRAVAGERAWQFCWRPRGASEHFG